MDRGDIKRALKVALAAAVTGGTIGAGAKLLGGATKLSEILKAGGAGAGIGALVGGGSNMLGNEVMGDPEYGDSNPNAKRGAVGGGLAGGIVGGVLGGLGAAGRFPKGISSLVSKMGEEAPAENMITRYINSLSHTPTPGNIAKGAGVGAAALGLPSAYYGADEGMGYDVVQREMDDEKKRRIAHKLAEQMMYGQG